MPLPVPAMLSLRNIHIRPLTASAAAAARLCILRSMSSGTSQLCLGLDPDPVDPTLPRLPRRLSLPPAFTPDVFTDVAIIGGGLVGLACAAHLSPNASVTLLEREPHLGTHASSRNSEVIHAGLYYPMGSLKTRMCIRGKQLLYEFARDHRVEHQACGKWIVAGEGGAERIRKLAAHAESVGVPVEWLPVDQVRRELQPNLSKHVKHVLHSPTSGIVSTHGLMDALRRVAEDDHGCSVATRSAVENVARMDDGRYVLKVVDPSDPHAEAWTLAANKVVNAAGVMADHLFRLGYLASHPALSFSPDASATANLDPFTHPLALRMYPARGFYFSLRRNATKHKVHRLIYPMPDPLGTSLGIHATVDLGGRAKFGPSLHWPKDLVGSRFDYSPPDQSQELELRRVFHQAVSEYLDGIEEEDLVYDYVGIRAKVSGPGVGAKDFVVEEAGSKWGMDGWVNLLGIESPGVTSCMAVAEEVGKMLQ
ncbi:FAD dependent oxidoreductase [Catenaria anguillulae PL171]|uniref:L-2-hydroxyglutarate dehydrogenase, mitochondrial n=1 Tax=Catenaria anguillulae PL171 TaxID=765915 RepID=A0A1Y2I207_9FUNG|nr:FAD dependent oxidoreductase [Catenaria anguillulae PL171]